jgi:hypothetical protein
LRSLLIPGLDFTLSEDEFHCAPTTKCLHTFLRMIASLFLIKEIYNETHY